MEVFSPFRVVGSVCGDVPVSYTTLYGAPVLMVATGRTFQLFRGNELSMLRGGPHFLHRVRAVAQSGKYRFVAEGPRVHALVHHKPLWSCAHNTITQSAVEHLLAADDILFSVGQDKRVAVWEVRTGKLLTEFLVERSETVTALVLPAGYANKLLLATAEGSLQLYNFKTGKCLWSTQRETDARVMSLASSSYKDIIAYGTSRGRVVVLNYGTNEEVMAFDHGEDDGAVTALAFRADRSVLVSGTSSGVVALWDLETRALDGVLTRTRQVTSEAEAHDAPHTDVVHSILVLAPNNNNNNNINANNNNTKNISNVAIVTAGADNALMQFRFDTVDGRGALVRERRGHTGSCTAAQFYNSDLLVTAGVDRALRVTHVFSDRASWELSQGKLGRRGREQHVGRDALKLPPAIALASCTARNYQWASLVSLHTASAQMCGWRMDTRVLDCKLSGIATSSHTARAVAMSDCGNFAVVGYSSGNVAVINVQNRSIRQLFDETLRSSSGGSGDRAHMAAVECVEVACGNSIIITAGLDACIKLWELLSSKLRATIATDCPMHRSCVHQPSSLFIVAQHVHVRVYNCNPDATLTLDELAVPVRNFHGHSNPITALALAPDTHRYILSASGDGALLVWDLAAAACIGQYRFTAPATSLSFHPDGLFLASTHVGEGGSFLWANNLRYGFVPEVIQNPSERAVETLPLLHFPTAHGEAEDDGTINDTKEKEKKNEADAEGQQQNGDGEEAELFDASRDVALARKRHEEEQLARLDGIVSGGMRLAGVPRSTWFNLTVLDQIKEKNQPLLPPKKRDVPFFLPTTQELRPTFLVVASDNNNNNKKKTNGSVANGNNNSGNNNNNNNNGAESSPNGDSRIAAAPLAEPTAVQRMLLGGEHDALMAHILELRTPQAIDLEIKRAVDFAEDSQYTRPELDRITGCLRGLLAFVAAWLRRRENVDLVQGILADLIRSHGPLITRCGETLVGALEEVAEQQNAVRYGLDHLVGYPSCLAGTFCGSLF